MTFAANLKADIAKSYKASRHKLGWRLLYSPTHVLDHADVAFIGLNPGGNGVDSAHGEFAMESGSAYCLERWGGKDPGGSILQQQVQAVCARLKVEPEHVLAGNLVPFRSSNWASLTDKRGALAFGQSIWTRILERAEPRIVVTMGRDAAKQVSRMLNVRNIERHTLAWGSISGLRGRYPGGAFVGLPHLSRYTVMTRAASQPGLGALFRDL